MNSGREREGRQIETETGRGRETLGELVPGAKAEAKAKAKAIAAVITTPINAN